MARNPFSCCVISGAFSSCFGRFMWILGYETCLYFLHQRDAETTQQRECFCVSAVLDRYIDFLHAAALKVTFNIALSLQS